MQIEHDLTETIHVSLLVVLAVANFGSNIMTRPNIGSNLSPLSCNPEITNFEEIGVGSRVVYVTD